MNRKALACAVVWFMTVGCGSARQGAGPREPTPVVGDGTAEAASPAEEKVLTELDAWPPAAKKTIDSLEVIAEAPYAAASGKTCRRLVMTSTRPPRSSKTRLACQSGDRWGFVPSVFLAPMSSETPSSSQTPTSSQTPSEHSEQ